MRISNNGIIVDVIMVRVSTLYGYMPCMRRKKCVSRKKNCMLFDHSKCRDSLTISVINLHFFIHNILTMERSSVGLEESSGPYRTSPPAPGERLDQCLHLDTQQSKSDGERECAMGHEKVHA